MSERREPELGDLDHIDPLTISATRDMPPDVAAVSAHQPRVKKRRIRWPWILAIAIVIVLGVAALLLWRAPLSNRLVPVPRQTLLLRDAQHALAQGRLTASDGSGAAELFQAVIAIDPDQQSAHEGLARVADAALEQARADLEHGRNAQARDALTLAHRLSAPAADTAVLDTQLREREGAGVSIGNLLDAASAAEAVGHLDDGAHGALTIYQQALGVAPGNAVVLARRNALLSGLLDQAAAKAQQGDVDAAQILIDRVAGLDPGHLDLPYARAHEATARAQRMRTRDRQLDLADIALRKGKLESALTGYRAALAQDASEQRARAGVLAVADAYAAQADHATANRDFLRAQLQLANARALAPDAPTILAAMHHLRSARMHQGTPRATPLSDAQRAQLNTTLDDADHAMDNGQLLDPPGDSAFDKLRAAEAIAPGDPALIAAQRRFGPAAVACFDRQLTANRLDRAEGCLDALTTVEPINPRLPHMRETLAERWLAVADERLGAGEFRAVRHALNSARKLSPRLHGLAAMEARLDLARGGNGKR